MNTVSVNVKSKEDASRKELLVRLVYVIPLTIVMVMLSIIGQLCIVLQWLHILVKAKRHPVLNEWIVKYLKYQFKVNAYACLATDERPEIIPE